MVDTAIDINCDLGEGFPNDAALMPFISSANIACGAHAGNEQTIETTIFHCLQHNVAIGAHPSFEDRKNFGRTEMYLSNQELYDLISRQLEIFAKVSFRLGTAIHHIKPHGALYNLSARDITAAGIIAKVVHHFDSDLILYGLAGSYSISEAKKMGLSTRSEVFADRTYQPNGQLTPRSQANALIQLDVEALRQVLQMVETQTVNTTSGSIIPIAAETICIHGDGAHAVTFAQKIYKSLNEKNISIKAF
jgi:UPF0271 protein